MCSEYQINTTHTKLLDALKSDIRNRTSNEEWSFTVKMTAKPPVIVKEDSGLSLIEKVFPVRPFPNARLSGFENQSDAGEAGSHEEAQVRRIYDVPMWKTGFSSSPCLVPVTSFTEFAYWGPEMGSVIQFQIPQEKIFFAAGLLVKPYTPPGKPGDGFAILTHTATEQMLEYHHRMIAIFRPQDAVGYLEDMSPQERAKYVLDHRYTDTLQTEKVRSMAKGWEKRVDKQKAKLEEELKFRETLKTEQVEG